MSVAPISTSKRGGDDPIEVAGGFPRHLTQELLEEEGRRGERRRWLAPWFFGAAYALFALSFPVLRVIGNFPIKAEAGESLWWMLLEASGGEVLGFALSALTVGLFLPLSTHALVATGLPRGPALTAALCVGLSPLMIHAATLPGPEALSGLLCLFAFWVAAPHDVGPARTSAAIAIGLGAALLDPGGLLVLPALLTRHFSRSGSGLSMPMYGWYGVAWGVAFVVAIQLLEGVLMPDVPVSRDSRVIRYAIFPGVIGLGLGFLAAFGLFRQQREGLTEDTPTWLRLWVVGGGASLFFPGASGICLAPVAAFAIADFLSRGVSTAKSTAALILIGQLILGLGSIEKVRSKDPNTAWRLQFRSVVEEGDTLISGSPAHRYLARIRWGFQTYHPDDPIGALQKPHVVDYGNSPPFLKRIVD
ncbi:MAG: hypothetical protein MK291_01980 [Planctomycetes bacterium]|nr:hypothetical protein [Planctomycetota bacterium]